MNARKNPRTNSRETTFSGLVCRRIWRNPKTAYFCADGVAYAVESARKGPVAQTRIKIDGVDAKGFLIKNVRLLSGERIPEVFFRPPKFGAEKGLTGEFYYPVRLANGTVLVRKPCICPTGDLQKICEEKTRE